MKTILCFGDSNTWGANPVEPRRLGIHERWSGVMRDELGADYWVIDEGLGGRTTVWDDPVEEHKNGLRYLLPCLDSHEPDLVIILLGTNDLKRRFNLSAWDIACGAGKLAGSVRRWAAVDGRPQPEIILACPPPILEVGRLGHLFAGGAEKSRQLAPHYETFARETGSRFFDVGAVVRSCPSEGIHWEPAEHARLGLAMAAAVREVFAG